MNIPIESNFYENVEKEGALKHIIYGDSVTGNGKVRYFYQRDEYNQPLTEIWDFLSTKYKIENISDKEYIFFTDQDFKILSFDLEDDKTFWTTPKYLMRHKFKGQIYSNYLTNDLCVSTTLNHSYVKVDIQKKVFLKEDPIKIQHVPVIRTGELRVPYKYSMMYGIDTDYDYCGIVKRLNKNTELLKNLVPYKLCKKIKSEFDGYVYDFEEPINHIFIVNNVLVHNTDSLFIEIPIQAKDNIDKIKLVNRAAKDINNLIIDYTKEFLLPRCGYSSERNEMNFKEELVIDHLIMIDVKKSYAYRQIASEAKIDPKTNKLVSGKIYSEPKITRKSGLGIKSDMIQMTKDILEGLISLSLNNEIDNNQKYEEALKFINTKKKEFVGDLKGFKMQSIGIPASWNKKELNLNAMKAYNAVIEKVFQPGEVGFIVYCKFNDLKVLEPLFHNSDIKGLDKLNALAFPIKLNREKIIEQMKKYKIIFDPTKQWENNIYNKTIRRIVEQLKGLA